MGSRKAIALFLSLGLAATVSACGNSEGGEGGEGGSGGTKTPSTQTQSPAPAKTP